VTRFELEGWIAAYERAWRSPGTGAVEELFDRDATYLTAPFREPHRGIDAIKRLWDAEREGPDERFTMTSEVLAVEGDTGVARIHVLYEQPPAEWLDMWIVRLGPEGRCVAFEEWPFAPQKPS
jgi:ketosteroid isomerase-like protein